MVKKRMVFCTRKKLSIYSGQIYEKKLNYGLFFLTFFCLFLPNILTLNIFLRTKRDNFTMKWGIFAIF